MLCNACGKNEASIHFKQIINGIPVEMHICKECAEKTIGIYKDIVKQVEDVIKNFSKNSSKLSSDKDDSKIDQKMDGDDLECPNCHTRYGDVRKGGLMGCPNCYTAFSEKISKKSASIAGEKYDDKKIEVLLDLKLKLNDAVERENYELAAKIRDDIKSLLSEEDVVSNE